MARSFSTTGSLSAGNPTALQISGTDFTVCAFANPTAVATNVMPIASKRGGGIATIAWELAVWSTNRWRFAISDQTTYDSIDSAGAPDLTKYTHVCGVKQGGTIYLYLDGVATSVASPTNLGGTPSSFTIGTDGTGFDFTGRICEVAVWAKALSAPEIAALALGVPPPMFRRLDLRGYWPIQGLVLPEPDFSGFANSAALVGTSLPQADHSRAIRYPLQVS